MRGSIDPIGTRAQINPVEVNRHDVFFAILPLQPEGEQHFLQFPRESAIGGKEHIFRQLLCHRRSALHKMPTAQVGGHRPQNTVHIDAMMRKKPAILRRQYGLNERLR